MCKSAEDAVKVAVNPIVSATSGLLGGGNNPPSIPDPQYSTLSPEELALIQKQGVTLDQVNSILSSATQGNTQAQNFLRQFSGLYDSNGNLNNTAVDSLQSRISQYQRQSDKLSQQSYNQLNQTFQQSPLSQASDQIGLAEAERLKNALSGNYTASSGLLNQEQKDYEKLREAAGQRGIKLEGNDLFTATSQSTAGNQLLADLRKNAESRRDSEKNTIISQATDANLNRLGLGMNQQNQTFNQANTLRTNPAAQTLGFLDSANQVGPQSLLSSYGNLASGYSSAMAPLTNNRLYNNQLSNANITANYGRNLAGYQNSQNQQAALYGTLGTIGGYALGGPMGGVLGNQVGQNLGFLR